MSLIEERFEKLEEAVAALGYVVARNLPHGVGARVAQANARFIAECRTLAEQMADSEEQSQSTTIKAAEYSLALDEILDLCESDPLYAAMLRPQLEKIGEHFNARTDTTP